MMMLDCMNSGLKNEVVTKLYFRCLNHLINPETYNMLTAQYEINIDSYSDGMSISISGYSEKFITILDFLIDSLFTTKSLITQELFESIQEIYRKELINRRFDQPYAVINNEMSAMILHESTLMKKFSKN